MASLALMVAIIFIITILSGPLSMLAHYFKFYFISKILSVIAVITGVYWLSVAPFPISTIGFVGIITGGRCLLKRSNKITKCP